MLSFLSYLMRQNIHVAGEHMMPELAISELEMGWIYASFIWGYAACQLPGGILGRLFGPRKTLLGAGFIWVVASGLTGFLPGTLVTSASGILVALIVVRFF